MLEFLVQPLKRELVFFYAWMMDSFCWNGLWVVKTKKVFNLINNINLQMEMTTCQTNCRQHWNQEATQRQSSSANPKTRT